MSQKKTGSILTLAMVLSGSIYTRSALAWGHLGHETIATIASKLVPAKGSFWAANAAEMGTLTNVPDQYWKSGPNADNEKPNHWFQIDSYYSDPSQYDLFPHVYGDAVAKYTEKTVITNGTAPWRIKQFYDLAVAALKRKDYATGLQMAGAMSHYIGDISQPLHVSKNFDGQETGDPGIHKFFETTNIQSSDHAQLDADVTADTKALLADSTFLADFNNNLVASSFNEINRAIACKDELISTDINTHRDPVALLKLAKSRMADGAASLAIVLGQLSNDAGLTDHEVSVNVSVPAWVSPDFSHAAVRPSFYPKSPVAELATYLDGGDCDQ